MLMTPNIASRFSEPDLKELAWQPDQAPAGRLIPEESVKLEKRGITSQPRELPTHGGAAAPQGVLWSQQTIHKNTIAAKLRSIGADVEASKLETCHSYYTIATCLDCGRTRKFPNRCDLFFCPECAGHLSYERKKQVEWWTQLIKQPKHVVLTIKNIRDLSPGHVIEFRKYFSALRRRKFCRNWKGGFYSLEVTNEGDGWHLHLHALVDAKWIDGGELARAWNSVTNGLGYIVKVRDCRKADYLAELTKYVVKGSQAATWPAQTILTFIEAFRGKRTFGVFGNLYAARTEFAEWIATLKQLRPKCECGSCRVTYQTELDEILQDLEALIPGAKRPPPITETQLQIDMRIQVWPD